MLAARLTTKVLLKVFSETFCNVLGFLVHKENLILKKDCFDQSIKKKDNDSGAIQIVHF